MQYILIIFLIITINLCPKILSDVAINKTNSDIYRCINKIYNNYYDLHALTYDGVYSDISFLNSTVNINSRYNKKLINRLWQFNLHIIITDDLINLNKYLKDLFESSNWNSKAKFILAYFGKDEPENVFRVTWQYYIMGIYLIYGQDGSILTHYPYENSCGNNIKPFFVAYCSDELPVLFESKLPLDLNGCEVKLMGLNLQPYVIDINSDKNDPSASGLEVTVMHNIAIRMNFTEKYLQNPYPHWGYLHADGSFSMMLKYLYEKKADVIFGMMIGNNSIGSFFDTTVSHIDTTAVWFVPTALQIAQWKNLTVIFDEEVWFAILVMFLINGLVWWLVGRNKEKLNEFTDLVLCVMGSFHILLQGSVKNPRNGILRMLVIIWTFSCLLLFTAHQCQLTGILTSPLYEHQISNLEELVTSKLQYGFYPVLLDLYGDKNNWVHRKVLQNYVPCTLDNECMNRTAYDRDFAVVKNKRQGKYLIPRYYSYPNGKPMLYSFSEVEFVVWVKYFTVKGFPFLERINRMIFLLQASGFIAKWEEDIIFIGKKGAEVSLHESLSLQHLEGAFYLLIIGLLISVTIFIIENCHKHINCRKLKYR